MTARDPDPDRFVDCRRLVLGVDMAEIPGQRSSDGTGLLLEDATEQGLLAASDAPDAAWITIRLRSVSEILNSFAMGK